MARRRPGLRKRLALNIFSDLYASTVAEHRLTTLFWECTLRCNLSCRHCGSDCRVDPGVPDMPLEDFLKVLDEEITPHVDPSEVLIIFSGGEVLVRDDLERAGAEVTRRGYAWGMVTNGMALTEARLRSLLDAGLRSVSVSLDGFEREHNHIRGNSRSYDRALAALRMIVREPSLTYDVVTCVTGAMVPQLEAFRDMLIAFRDQDANGNGDPNDEIPFSGNATSWNSTIYPFLLNSFLHYDTSNLSVKEDGTVIFTPIQPEFKEGLQWIASLIDEGLIEKEALTQTEEHLKTKGSNLDTALLGGFILELEGVTYDKSVRGALSGLSRQLEERRMA